MPATQDQVKVSGRAIKTNRLRLGLTLRQLAALCADHGRSVDASQLCRYENGDVSPTPASLKAVAGALGVQVDDLLEATTT